MKSIRSIFRLLSTKFSSPELGAFAYSFVALFITLFGILRERILAGMIGPGPILDAYVLAHKIPDVLYVTTAALFVSTTLLPHIARAKTPETRKQLFSEMYTIQLIGSIILALLLVVFIPYIIPVIGSGFTPETIEMAINMSRVILLSPVLMGMSHLLGINSNMNKQFILVALSPLLYNIGTVLGIWLGYGALGYMILPVAVLIGALLHMLVQLLASYAKGVIPVLTTNINWRRAFTVLGNAIPRTFTTATVPLTSLGIIALASYLPSGSVSLLNFGIVIQNVPVTLIGSSLAIAAFPLLVDLADNREQFSDRVTRSFRVIMTVAMPIIALMWVLKGELVTLLLSTGQFTTEHVASTSAIVGLLVLGLAAQSITLMGSRIYYAHEKTWQPFIQNLIGMICALVFAFITFNYIGAHILVLAAAYVVGWWITAIITLIRISATYCTKHDVTSMIRGFAGSILSGIIVGIVAYLVYQLVLSWRIDGEIVSIIARSFVVGVSGALAGYGTLTIIGDEEAKMFTKFIKKKLKIKDHASELPIK